MDKKLFTGIIIGIILGFLINLFGTEFFLENTKTVLIFLAIILFVILLILIILYSLRNKLLSAAKLNFIVESDMAESSSKLAAGVLNKDSKQIAENTEFLVKNLVDKYIQGQTRAWMFRAAFTLFATVGGIFATLITLKQNEIVEKQNRLIEEQANYLADMEKPFMDVKPHRLDWTENSNQIYVDLDLELINIGKRAATNLHYILEFYEYFEDRNAIEAIETKIEEELINPLSPNSSIVINSAFKKPTNKSTILVYLKPVYSDPIKKDSIFNSEFIYKIPPPVKDPYIPTSLMVGNKIHKEQLMKYLNKK